MNRSKDLFLKIKRPNLMNAKNYLQALTASHLMCEKAFILTLKLNRLNPLSLRGIVF